MSTKTASVRLDTELYDKIDQRCVSKGCSRNDYIKDAIEAALQKEDDDVAHQPYDDDLGNRWYWDKNDEVWVCQIDPKNLTIIP